MKKEPINYRLFLTFFVWFIKGSHALIIPLYKIKSIIKKCSKLVALTIIEAK